MISFLRRVFTLFKELDCMSAAVDKLTEEVTEIGTVVGSAIVLINGLAQQLRDAAGDPVKIEALAAELDATSAALAAAITANTPSTEEPPAEPS